MSFVAVPSGFVFYCSDGLSFVLCSNPFYVKVSGFSFEVRVFCTKNTLPNILTIGSVRFIGGVCSALEAGENSCRMLVGGLRNQRLGGKGIILKLTL